MTNIIFENIHPTEEKGLYVLTPFSLKEFSEKIEELLKGQGIVLPTIHWKIERDTITMELTALNQNAFDVGLLLDISDWIEYVKGDNDIYVKLHFKKRLIVI